MKNKIIISFMLLTVAVFMATGCGTSSETEEANEEIVEEISETEIEEEPEEIEEEPEAVEEVTEEESTETETVEAAYTEEELREMIDPDVHITYAELLYESTFDDVMTEAIEYITETEYADNVTKYGKETAIYNTTTQTLGLAQFYQDGIISKEDYYKAVLDSDYYIELTDSINAGTYTNPDKGTVTTGQTGTSTSDNGTSNNGNSGSGNGGTGNSGTNDTGTTDTGTTNSGGQPVVSGGDEAPTYSSDEEAMAAMQEILGGTNLMGVESTGQTNKEGVEIH
ncbi:MAG: hypothetical protein LUH58_00450 [Lachnospiraceae bacterium]|nr:hypothetical protein [Lachnospiraceae bacterium]